MQEVKVLSSSEDDDKADYLDHLICLPSIYISKDSPPALPLLLSNEEENKASYNQKKKTGRRVEWILGKQILILETIYEGKIWFKEPLLIQSEVLKIENLEDDHESLEEIEKKSLVQEVLEEIVEKVVIDFDRIVFSESFENEEEVDDGDTESVEFSEDEDWDNLLPDSDEELKPAQKTSRVKKLENMISGERLKYDRHENGYVAEIKVKGSMILKENERSFEVVENCITKQMKVDEEVNEKLFGIKKSGEEDTKVAGKDEKEKLTEIWSTEIEDVKENKKDKAVDSDDKNLYIDLSGSDICENISFGNEEDEEKIWNFICNGKSKELEANKKSKEQNDISQNEGKNDMKTNSSVIVAKIEKDKVNKTRMVPVVQESVILKDIKDIRKKKDKKLLEVSTDLQKCDKEEICVERTKSFVILGDAEKYEYKAKPIEAVKNIEILEDFNDKTNEQIECTGQNKYFRKKLFSRKKQSSSKDKNTTIEAIATKHPKKKNLFRRFFSRFSKVLNCFKSSETQD